jgi:hypothetical protein
LVSTDCGVTWTPVYDKAGTALSTAPVTTSAFTPNATQWRTDSVIMGAYAGQTELMIAFASTSNFGNNFYVDDIFIGGYLTEIAEPETENTISIFPNPAASVLHLTISEQLTTAGTMNIFSADGKLVKSFSIPVNKNVVELDIADLENGIYVISINSDRNVLTRRIVKL